METGLLAVTVGCMAGLMFIHWNSPFAFVYFGAAVLYAGLLRAAW